jgi:hypothetical protein
MVRIGKTSVRYVACSESETRRLAGEVAELQVRSILAAPKAGEISDEKGQKAARN